MRRVRIGVMQCILSHDAELSSALDRLGNKLHAHQVLIPDTGALPHFTPNVQLDALDADLSSNRNGVRRAHADAGARPVFDDGEGVARRPVRILPFHFHSADDGPPGLRTPVVHIWLIGSRAKQRDKVLLKFL